MARTRIYVDSVIDKNHVRVLISTDGKTEKPVIMEKGALEELLKDRDDLWEKDRKTNKRVRIKRDIEGEVISFEQSDTPFFKDLTKKVESAKRAGRPIKRIKRREIRGLKKPKKVTGERRKKLRKRQKKLRRRVEGT